MKHFPPLRTKRISVQLKEISIGDAIRISAMPVQADEAGKTAFLRASVETTKGCDPDPARWTVQERTIAVCHYLASILEDGPDFSLSGGVGRYSDYLDGAADIPASMVDAPIGEVGGDEWRVAHLLGAHAEAIERTHGSIEGFSGRLHWLMGCMAAQLRRTGEDQGPDPVDMPGEYEDWLIARINTLSGYPESDFADLMGRYLTGREKLHHLIRIEQADDGLICLPKEGAAEGLPPARFPVHTCISRLAHDLGGKSARSGE